MELIIAILCFLGLMSYNEAGVTQQQVEEVMRSNNITVDATTERAVTHVKIDRSED